ncbi:ornithine cyclodeaminase family protein [Halomarina ordinaria]|uniref:Ornithine cyclodeaminase family protein n=1 Tax=Halomarina ordinaria TaxID=3033939 RepID=A0ABD5U9F4_9EURY|nr:ornithine cyclodeaminase family protein [Halomarina sp. PSRA2]
MVRILSADEVRSLLSLPDLLDVVEDAFRRQGRGAVERPPRPHFPVGTGLVDAPGTGLTMPAYLHGEATYATKLVTVQPANAARGLPTTRAQVVVTDAETGECLALLAGEPVTNARTGCIGGTAVRHLAATPVRLGLLGAGAQARWQARAVDAAVPLGSVRVYSPSDSRERCAATLDAELGADVRAVDAPEAAVADATVVVTATTSETPVFPGAALADGTLVVAVGAYTSAMRELDGETVARAARVFADVPEEAADVGDVADAGLSEEDLLPLSAVFEGEAGRAREEEVLVVESVGSAVLDAAAAGMVYERAQEEGVGTDVPL